MENEVLQRLEQRIDALVISLEKGNAPAIWSADDIAEWLDLSVFTIKQSVVARPGFPNAILATGAKSGQKRWFADEVIEWVRKNRGTLPAARPAGRRRKSA
ncbi:hypothetical protein [Chromobacterium sp.]|uniref:hypothetical protein n=1 Tax=Chromobacterium sp. TaxID=306190 RepID=UPI0035B043BA